MNSPQCSGHTKGSGCTCDAATRARSFSDEWRTAVEAGENISLMWTMGIKAGIEKACLRHLDTGFICSQKVKMKANARDLAVEMK